MLTRRAILAVPLLASCRRSEPYFSGYAFVANQDGASVAAIDLGVLAVAKHIPLEGPPSAVVASHARPAVYAVTPESRAIHEIETTTLKLARRLGLAGAPQAVAMAPEHESLYVLTRDPYALVHVTLDRFRVRWTLPLEDQPTQFALAPDGVTASIAGPNSVRMVNLAGRKAGPALGRSDYGELRFLNNSSTLIAADRANRQLSLFRASDGRLIAHLPLAVRPDHLCFNSDGGQLFVTGEGMDAVVIVYPFNTPMVGATVLAGHVPGAIATSRSLIFVASPGSGDVSILSVATHKLIGVVQVGTDPGFIAVTPDDEYALVLNRQSGDVAVIRVPTITPNRLKSAALLTVIPVGARPVSADFRAV